MSPVVFALYGGDVNQDGTIDASDLSETTMMLTILSPVMLTLILRVMIL
ncbi:MAG: hypothetical protein IPL16_06075 [Ignavibacteria bacterium]|nr:hypothetical protein [Ignavibacteria bacterium]